MTYNATFDPKTKQILFSTHSMPVRLSSWPQPIARYRDAIRNRVRPNLNARHGLSPLVWDRSEPFEPQMGLTFGYEDWEAWQQYWLSYPPEVLRRVCLFTNHALHIAQFMAAGGTDLVDQHPALAFRVALKSRKRYKELLATEPARLAEEFLAVGFDPERSLQFFDYLSPAAMSPDFLHAYQCILSYPRSHPVIERIGRVNRPFMDLMHLEMAFQAGWALLEELASPRYDHRQDLVGQIARLLTAWDPAGQRKLEIDTMSQLMDYLQILNHDTRELPPPPFPGMPGIVPVTCLDELAELLDEDVSPQERLHLRQQIQAGRCAYYHLESEQGGMLLLTNSRNGWKLEHVYIPNEVTRQLAATLGGDPLAEEPAETTESDPYPF